MIALVSCIGVAIGSVVLTIRKEQRLADAAAESARKGVDV
jgi:hypothetical protein